MKLAFMIIGIIFLIGLSVWLHTTSFFTGEKASVHVEVPTPTVNKDVNTVSAESGWVTIDGTALLDTSGGTPAVPYIKYSQPDGDTATKQLIFADERGCLPNAGDLPCVPTYPVESAYPQLNDGAHIVATGYIRENRLLVRSLRME